MKKRNLFVLICFSALLLSSCGALPTLPPLDSTVTIWTPRATSALHQETAAPETETPMVVNTDRPAATQKPVTATPTVKPVNTSTKTPIPYTATPGFTKTPTRTPTATATKTPVPTSTPTSVPYTLQLMNPYYLKNFTHPDQGCNWLGVAGQIFNRDGLVQKDIVIRAGGEINGKPVVEQMTMPLAEPPVDLAYGPGGFEVTLAATLVESKTAVWIQLFNLKGDPLSAKVYLTTYNDCQKNLILLNFVE